MDGLHLAIIPDGNRRWARDRGKDEVEGHAAGIETAKNLWDWLDDSDVRELTLWGLSRDNAERRSEAEIAHLNDLFADYAERLAEPGSKVHEQEVRVRVVGDPAVLEERARSALQELEEATEGYDEGRFNIALGYDGRWDVAQAAERVDGDITEDAIADNLALPEIDIVVGYGDDRAHLSHLANWQVGYATLVFPRKNWPAAEEEDFRDAIERHRDRKKSRGR